MLTIILPTVTIVLLQCLHGFVHDFSSNFPKFAQFSRSLDLLTGTLFACCSDWENPNCTSQILVHQKVRMLAYILVPNLTCLEKIY